MALALFSAGEPVVTALPADALEPAAMAGAEAWKKLRPVALAGFSGAAAQDTEVRVLWNEEWLFFAFDCSDTSIVSPGDRDGLEHFRLGDTVEVFVASRGAKSYAEIHATPAGHKTLYFCGDYRRPAPAPPAADRISVEAARTERGWKAFVAVPRELLGKADRPSTCDVFFARYDYDREGARPVLSSFPGQKGDKPDFHRRADYAILELKP